MSFEQVILPWLVQQGPAVIFAWLLPLLIAFITREDWSSATKEILATSVCLIAGVGEVYLTGGFNDGAGWATVISIIGIAKWSYMKFWHEDGIVWYIEKNLGITLPSQPVEYKDNISDFPPAA